MSLPLLVFFPPALLKVLPSLPFWEVSLSMFNESLKWPVENADHYGILCGQ